MHETAPFFQFNHRFFSNEGGVSGHDDAPYYGALNCGPGSNDDPANVDENRRIVAEIISGRRDTPVLSCYQIHGNICTIAKDNWATDRPKADAMVTNQPDLILGILTADCAPVLFEDSKNGIIGAAHAGWKGAISGITESCIEAMIAIGAEETHIKAAIGPCIHQASYEIGADMRTALLEQDAQCESFIKAGKDAQHFHFNLPAYVENRLKRRTLNSVWTSPTDTYTSPNHFSYRRTTHRQEIDYGRQISAIMLPVS